MDLPDQLCKKLYVWIERQESCADALLDLAQELKKLRETVNTGKIIGSACTVGGSAALAVAGGLTLLTGGLAAPLLIPVATVTSTGGTALNLSLTLAENWCSSDTMKGARKIINRTQRTREEIQRLMKLLRDVCLRSVSDMDADIDVDNMVTMHIVEALARGSGLNLPRNVFRFMVNNARGLLAESMERHVAGLKMIFAASGLMMLHEGALMASSGLKEGFTVAATGGLKTAAEGSIQVAGGVIGLALSLPDLIDNCNDLIKNNHETEASERLRSTAQDLRDAAEDLKRNLDLICEKLKNIAQVIEAIKNLGPYTHHETEEGRIILEYLQEMWGNAYHKAVPISTYESVFLNFIRFFYKHMMDRHREELRGIERLHVAFIAHGHITKQQVPASSLLLSPIDDVILYSPWNCLIDANVAFGIAKGSIQPSNRVFKPTTNTPRPLPQDWNRMRQARWSYIPQIWLSPATEKDCAWKEFCELQALLGFWRPRRFIIPYVVPSEDKDHFPSIPFDVILGALSACLMFTQKYVTVHLAACLGHPGDASHWDRFLWKKQYARAPDNTLMSADLGIDQNNNRFKALQSIFGSFQKPLW